MWSLCAVHRIANTDSILIIQPEWLKKILDGSKDLEIRGKPCHKKVGTRIFLSASESSAVSGSALVVDCHGPLTEGEWERMRPRHRVPGMRTYGKHTHAYELAGVRRLKCIPIRRKQGSVVWQTGPGW